nr:hypothetical protein [Candidatus Gracilibacteria bacterium]
MRNLKIYIRILIFTLFSVIFFSVSATEVVTIKELQQNIKVLEEKQGEITKKFSSDLGDIGDIKNFLKDNLSEKEVEEIKLIINNYNKSKENIIDNNNNLEDIKQSLLDLKKEVYKKLIPYIEQGNLQDYLNYIKTNVEVFKQGKDLDYEIDKNKELLEQKVSLIKEKIKVHESELKNEIDELINKKIDEKIDIIKNNEKFKILDLEKRKALISKTIEKIKEKLNDIEVTTENQKKIDIYNIVIQKLEEVFSELK